MPLQSLVLLPPLQRPMLPLALLPLIRHGGSGPAEAEEGPGALPENDYICGWEKEKWPQHPDRRCFIGSAPDASQDKSFRRGHVSCTSHPLAFICPTPYRFQPMTFSECSYEQKMSYLRGLKKGKTYYFIRLLRSNSYSSAAGKRGGIRQTSLVSGVS